MSTLAKYKGYTATLEGKSIVIQNSKGEKVADASHDWACNAWFAYVYSVPEADGILDGWDTGTPEQIAALMVYTVHALLEEDQQ